MRDTGGLSAGIRDVLNGAAIRALAEIRDVGDLIIGKIENLDGGDAHDLAEDRRDVWAHLTNAVSGVPVIGRLFFAGNMLFRLPRKGDSCMALRGAEASGPGTRYVLHGDCGGAGAVPGWLSMLRSGISVPEHLRFESTEGNVELQGNDVGVAREHDTVNKNDAMATWMTAVSSALSILAVPTTIGTISSSSPTVKTKSG